MTSSGWPHLVNADVVPHFFDKTDLQIRHFAIHLSLLSTTVKLVKANLIIAGSVIMFATLFDAIEASYNNVHRSTVYEYGRKTHSSLW